ncbi:hypothetical protein [Rhodoluna sp.]|uniref:hypothetical protein n=1 Tax=Rhodoluna sp. TaxID=1969481 RepID=UPI0025D1FB4F|nr:hypothetical protein [Rhodoluna sp.]
MAESKKPKTTIKTEDVRIRRSPKYLQFLLTGGVVGFVLALIVGFSIPEEQRTAEPIITYLIAYFAGGGAALALTLGVVLDRIFLARAKTAKATKLEA